MSGDFRERPETLAAQALGWVEPTTRSVVPAIYPSTLYERAPDGSYPGGHTYTRDQNPTYAQVESLLNRLEGGDGALSCFVDAVPWDCVPLHRLVPGALRRLEPVVDVGEFTLFVEWWVLHE